MSSLNGIKKVTFSFIMNFSKLYEYAAYCLYVAIDRIDWIFYLFWFFSVVKKLLSLNVYFCFMSMLWSMQNLNLFGPVACVGQKIKTKSSQWSFLVLIYLL